MFFLFTKIFCFVTIISVIIVKIGIDIDDTMTFIKEDLEKAAILYDKSLGNSGKFLNNDYYLGKRFNWNKEQYSYFMGTIREQVVCNAKLRDGLIKCLSDFINNGIEIVIITARNNTYYKDALNMTLNWLNKEKIPYSKLIINAQNKAKTCQKEKIDIFIDDDIKNCLEVNKIGIKTFIMDNVNNTLNNDEIIRIKDFNEFNKYVNLYIQNKK